MFKSLTSWMYVDKEGDTDKTPSTDYSKPLGGQIEGTKTPPYSPLAGPLVMPGQQAASSTQISVSEEEKQKMTAYFQELYNKNNTPAPSYHEFVDTVSELSADIPNIGSLYQKSFKILAKQGLTRDILITTAQSTLNMLTTDAIQFVNMMDGKLRDDIANTNTTIQQKQLQVTNIDNQIKQLQQQIATLQQQQAVIQTELAGMTDSANKVTEKCNRAKSNYAFISNQFIEKIKADLQNITAYIQ